MTSGRPAVFNIAPGRPFVDTLAAGLLARADGDPLRLGAMTVLLPTRRACRALADAFLRAGQGRPLLLPRMVALGDIDEEELQLGVAGEDVLADALDLPSAIAPLRRQLLLSRLILRLGEVRDEGPVNADQAARLAAELARLLDQIQIERLGFDRLAELVPEDYAAHWQITLDFLKLLTEHWPAILVEQGSMDPAARRNALIEAQAARWRAAPPTEPVIAAGSTGSVPATAELLAVVSRLPQGCLVLPGLDRGMDAAGWRVLEAGHPQYGQAQLLGALDVDRTTVPEWDGGTEERAGRARLISEALRPAQTTDAWRKVEIDAAALTGVARIDCPGPEEEARVVALLLRETLEQPGRSAALVTPDRALARRVAAELRRWGIEIDDSAGEPLADTTPGGFLRLVAALVAEAAAPVPLLAALKHPLAAGGMPPGAFRANVRRLELALLRGPRPAPHVAGLRAALGHRHPALQDLDEWLTRLEDTLTPLAQAIGQRSVPLASLLAAHIDAAESLAATDTKSGADRLWAGEAGEAAAGFVAELKEAGVAFGRVSGRVYPTLLESLMDGRVVRPRYGRHPRLAIWGPLEARLQHADHLVLGGLNEGTWPPESAADPWMSRPMRKDFGLPALERRIGLAAHDFAQAFCAPRVSLTRAMRVEGTPTVPSRWLLRLDNLLRAAGHATGLGSAAPWLDWQDRLDRPESIQPVDPPRPLPPVAARPRQLSATQVETWLRDPYAIYARHVLSLRALDPIDADPGAAERGIFIHKALDRFQRDWPGRLPADAFERLVEIGRATFGVALDRPGVWAFWWPRFERIAAWFVEQERGRRSRISASASEVRGRLEIAAPEGIFTLTATADRVDHLRDGGIEIIDYKTGGLPTKPEIASGAAPQLPLEAAIAGAGGFDGLPAGSVTALDYWRLAGGDPAGEVLTAPQEPSVLAEIAAAGLAALVAAFDDPTTPYLAQPRPALAPRFSDYAHLARIKEWSAMGGADGE